MPETRTRAQLCVLCSSLFIPAGSRAPLPPAVHLKELLVHSAWATRTLSDAGISVVRPVCPAGWRF